MALASIGDNPKSDSWDLRIENLNSNEKIEISFTNEKEFYSYLENNISSIAFEDQGQCSATVTITVGVASASFTMTGDCEGFGGRFARRVAQTRASLTVVAEESSWWNSWF
ncbi:MULTISPECIES: hypothetical protein [unclassified Polaribacter]|uniref:hypothetical protein n=1 Tax=unclassified Polaribacter TaxID=196858 RepID=UPI0011BD4553|nr:MULTISPECIES: hypothetical protein [unclassified Polaribacter]TXD49026.1 hypothetical protein ES043_17440 [Polaribacter sp. IC063]TXD56030.1 hypothetical protein ES044_17460 [Polaribacter sp. IC066]